MYFIIGENPTICLIPILCGDNFLMTLKSTLPRLKINHNNTVIYTRLNSQRGKRRDDVFPSTIGKETPLTNVYNSQLRATRNYCITLQSFYAACGREGKRKGTLLSREKRDNDDRRKADRRKGGSDRRDREGMHRVTPSERCRVAGVSCVRGARADSD